MMLAQCDLAVNDGAGALKTIRPLADSVLAGPRELDLAVRAAAMAHDPALSGYVARRQAPQLAANTAAARQALAASARRDWAGVLAAYRTIPGVDQDAEVLKRMALAASNLGQADPALRDADRALALDPGNPDMLHIAGLVRLNVGRDRATAQTLLKQALERDPANRIFRADLARAGG
jgi:tetratricopeptide (TPR) repeat protein